MRRATAVTIATLAASLAVFVTAPAALAAGTPRVESPLEGAAVSSPTPVRVLVQEQCGPLSPAPTGAVDVRLSADGNATYPGTAPAALARTEDCTGASPDSTWEGATIDPRSPADFAGDGAPPLCNGRWRVQARADGGAWSTGASFTVSQPPAAPTGVQVAVDGDEVTVTWARGREPDLAAYQVERREAGSDTWSRVERVGAGTTTVTDAGVAPGEHEYRVVALRPDGAEGGSVVRACQDTGADLATPSTVRTASVAEPEPTPTTSAGGSSGSDGGSSTDGGSDGATTGGTSGGSTDGSAGATDGSSTDGSTGGSDGSTAPAGDGTSTGADDGSGSSTGGSTRPRRRIAAPPPAARDGNAVAAPDLPDSQPQVAQPRERYYGEDQEYTDELDFGTVDPVTGTETRRRSTLQERVVPQAVQAFVERFVDPQRVLKPLAVGLLLVAVALHLVRWTRETDGG